MPVQQKKKPKTRKVSKSLPVTQQLRNFGLPENLARKGKYILKYQSNIEKSVYWYYFSNLRKLQDLKKYGTCISCGRKLYEINEQANAGHFVPTANCGFALLFHPLNVNLECAGCNAFDPGHLIGYRINLDARYGEGTSDKLWQMKWKPTKEWSRLEYIANIEVVRAQYEQLLKN